VFLIPVLFVAVEKVIGRGHVTAADAGAAPKPTLTHGAEV
jgi:hypothetical protein